MIQQSDRSDCDRSWLGPFLKVALSLLPLHYLTGGITLSVILLVQAGSSPAGIEEFRPGTWPMAMGKLRRGFSAARNWPWQFWHL